MSITNTKQTLKDGAISGFCRSFWGRSWIWCKSFGFSDYYAIPYYNQTVLAIALDLNMLYSVFPLLISFLKAPWYGLVYSVRGFTTTWRGCWATVYLVNKLQSNSELSIYFCFKLLQVTPDEVYLQLLYFYLLQISQFIMFHY